MKTFRIITVNGEYATLADEKGEELFIAMALLPIGADVGTCLSYDGMEFAILPQN